MKKITSLMSTVITMAVLTTVLSLTSCQKESPSQIPDKISDQATLGSAEKSGAPLKVDGMQAYLRVKNSAGNPINAATTDGTTPLWTRPGRQTGANLLPVIPLVAPDGHQLTLAEFRTVSGWSDFKCINTGTHGVFHMKGLIPNGVYTIWIFTFGSAGPPTMIGAGAFGAPDGSNNSLVADAEGTASISITLPGGDLGGFGTVGNCLSSVVESHILAAYHPDNHTHGAGPGSTWVGHIFFPVRGIKLL